MSRRVVRRNNHVDHTRIRHFRLGEGLQSVSDLCDELEDMREVLLGHIEPPMKMGISTMLETAEGYFSRACDIEQRIFTACKNGTLPKGTKMFRDYNAFRTQELRSFKEMAKSAAEAGSRRITAANLEFERQRTGRESA